MKTSNLEYLIAIADEGNLSRAANKLYISQPALSKALAAYEKELGVRLFTRFSGRIALTEAGKIYIDAARKMLAVWNETSEQLSQISSNIVYPDVRIGINSATSINEMMVNMMAHLQTEIPIFYEVDSVECIRMLREGLIDIACLAFPDGLPNDFESVFEEPDELAVAVPNVPDFNYINLQYSETLPAKVLNGAKAIRCRPDSGLGIFVDRYLKENNIELDSLCAMSVLGAVLAGVENGNGLAIVHRTLLRDTSSYRIYSLDPPCRYHHHLCIKKGTVPTPKLKRIINFLWDEKIF